MKPDWMPLRAAHERRVSPWIQPRIDRMSRQERHPVEDFLFEYYSYRPGQLLRWHPGIGVTVRGGDSRDLLTHKWYRETGAGVAALPAPMPAPRRAAVEWIRAMLRLTQDRVASFRCFGLHEWAMVYRSGAVRHEKWPLRLTPEEIAAVIDSASVCCSHYDAFRFFTPAARPLNKLQPERATIASFEQPGCLHANMDLYKWAYKLAPFSSSELVADAFELAHSTRVLDMRASPYDFSALGLAPVCIETPDGRAEYEAAQRGFAMLAAPLRERLIALCDTILSHASPAAAELPEFQLST